MKLLDAIRVLIISYTVTCCISGVLRSYSLNTYLNSHTQGPCSMSVSCPYSHREYVCVYTISGLQLRIAAVYPVGRLTFDKVGGRVCTGLVAE